MRGRSTPRGTKSQPLRILSRPEAGLLNSRCGSRPSRPPPGQNAARIALRGHAWKQAAPPLRNSGRKLALRGLFSERLDMRAGLTTIGAAIALATASLATMSTEGRAEIAYPWCAISSMSMGIQTCSFASLEQCKAYVTSTGFCQPNARSTAPAGAARPVDNARSRSPAARRDLF